MRSRNGLSTSPMTVILACAASITGSGHFHVFDTCAAPWLPGKTVGAAPADTNSCSTPNPAGKCDPGDMTISSASASRTRNEHLFGKSVVKSIGVICSSLGSFSTWPMPTGETNSMPI
jgi:hypothetical protein